VIQSHAPVSAFLFLAACAAAGCTDSEATPDVRPEDPAVPTVVVESVTVDVPLSLPAQLHVEKDALVHARSEGVVEWLGADLGTRVARGQLLARLESADQEIAAARAEEVHAVALRDARRQRELTLSGVSTPADSELVESALRRAELDLRQARRNLELTRVTAPFAGIVSARYARAGRLAAAGDSLFRVTAMAPLLATVQLPESDAAGLEIGSRAQVVGTGGAADARVLHLGPVVDPASGTRQVVLQLEQAKGLRPGGSAVVRLGQRHRVALALPEGIAGPEGLVLVMEAGGPTARAVTFGEPLADGKVEVLSGLAAGERVVRAGR